jgi:hypothetical protein
MFFLIVKTVDTKVFDKRAVSICRFDPEDGGNVLLLIASIHLQDFKIFQKQKRLET